MKLFYLALMGTGLLWATSCQSVYYAPNAHNVPLFQQQHEARLMVTQTKGDYISGYEAQVAYAPLNHVGIIAGGYTAKRDTSGQGKYYEAGIGTFYSLYKHIVVECYFGYGNGEAFNNFNLNRFIKNRFTKYFIQPSIGFSTRYIDFSVSARLAQLDLYDIEKWQTSNNTSGQYSSIIEKEYNQLIDNKRTMLFEPGFTLRVGWKYFKIQAQGSSSGFIGHRYFDIDHSNLNLGLYFTLAKKNKPGFEKISQYD